jgi:L-threonylcarbamoyladenylate synthase
MARRARTQIVSASDPSALERALDVLRLGGLVAFPTDTVYGLGALAFEAPAVAGLYDAKGRAGEKAIPVLVGEKEAIDVVGLPSEMARRLAAKLWPGAITLVIRKAPQLPEAVSAAGTVGVRMPNHPIALGLLHAAGPLAVTSANRSGRASPRSAEAVRAELEGRVELILDGGACPGGMPSTVVDCTGEKPVIVRQGPITVEQIEALLEAT